MVSKIQICFDINGNYVFEGNHLLKGQDVLNIPNMENSSLDNQNNNSKYSSVLDSDRDDDIWKQNHRLLNVYVNCLKKFIMVFNISYL